ncbi:MAG: hypothetical protein OCC49_04845 [Fibrobacterales bacterium]
MNIHLDYHDPIRPPKAHRVDAPEAATTHSEVEKHLIDNEEHKKHQQQSGQQQQSKQDSVEAKLLASIQDILKKPIFAGNLSTQSIETLGTIFEKLHDLESDVKIREQIRRLLQELANSPVDELNLLEKKIKQLISNELLRVVPANSTLHQADKMAIRLLNHLSVNDFSAAREATTLLHSFIKSPSSTTYTPTTKFGNTVVQQLLDATAFSNQKLNLPQVSDIALEFKQRLATPLTAKQAQLLSTQIEKTQSPFLLGHVVSREKGSTSIVVEGRQLILPKELGLKPGESFLFELVDKKESPTTTQAPTKQGIYIHPATAEASPQTLKLFSNTTTPIEQLLKLYSAKNNPKQAELEIDRLLKSAPPKTSLEKNSSQLVSSEIMRHSTKTPPFLQKVSPTPRVIETIGFLNQYQELFQKAAPQTVQAVSNLFYTAETMLSHGENLKPTQEELLFKLLLANNLELPSPKEIERVLQYDGFKSVDRNLVPPNNPKLLQQLQGVFPNKPLSAFETLTLLQTLHESSDTMRESTVLRTLIDHVQTNLFEQQTQEQNNQQSLYWMHNQNLQKGRITVKDDREKDQSGSPKEGPIGFVLETQTPNLGDVSINFHLDSDNVDIMLLDSHGTHGSIVDSERADLAKEFQVLGWNLEQLRYGLLAGKDRAAEPSAPPQKPVGWDGIDLKA